MKWIALGTEDALSEAVGKKLIGELGGDFAVGPLLRRDGYGYLRKNLRSFCEMARRQPVLLITDLDQKPCPAALMEDWFGAMSRPPFMLFRVAVREIESWVLADHALMHRLLGKATSKLPLQTDHVPDPKRHLIQLASRGPRELRYRLVPQAGSTATQGPEYNLTLIAMVQQHWNAEEAERHSESLRQVRVRLRELAAS